jgi:uncharacterized membrane protein
MIKKRDKTIDVLRGLAILIMLAANSSATIYAEPHPFWFRCLSSVAAPLFITLSGMMVCFSQLKKDYPFTYFLKRGLVLIGIAALRDIAAWRMLPFTSFDVLYVIGLSAPIAFLFGRINKTSIQWILIGAIFLLTPVLQHLFGYTTLPSMFKFDGSYWVVVENQTGVLNHLFIDGWFPVFPWLGFSLFGVMLGSYRWKDRDTQIFFNKEIVFVAAVCLFVGILLKIIFPVHLYIRVGFGEVFYPPTLGFCIYTVGIILALFGAFEKNASSRIFEPASTIGRTSLFIYILHTFVINYGFSLFLEELDGIRFALFWLCFAALMTGVAYGLKFLKKKWKRQPWFFRFLLGG